MKRELNWLHPSTRKNNISKKICKAYNTIFGKDPESIHGWVQIMSSLSGDEVMCLERYKWNSWNFLHNNALFQEALFGRLLEIKFKLEEK